MMHKVLVWAILYGRRYHLRGLVGVYLILEMSGNNHPKKTRQIETLLGLT